MLKKADLRPCHKNVSFYWLKLRVGHDPWLDDICNQKTDSVKLMHPTFKSSHDFAPHSLRFKGRIKEGSLNTQDRIRWARLNLDATLSMVTQRIRFDERLGGRLKTVAS